ncbi:MAG: DUF5071 domain-containing protein [Pyrinomonadaceae bacterium]
MDSSDIRLLIPKDKHDIENAQRAIEIGYPAVEPILPELLEWLQDLNWPVARVLAPFLSSVGKPLVPYICEIFKTDDDMWKYWIITTILEESVELANAFRNEIERIAYSPTDNEKDERLNDTALDLLKKYGWQKS